MLTAAGVALLGALLAAIRDMHMTALDKVFSLVLIGVGIAAAWFFLEDLQNGLANVRKALDPGASTRGRPILNVHKTILVGAAFFVAWFIVFKLQ
jgi:hypothetical protein